MHSPTLIDDATIVGTELMDIGLLLQVFAFTLRADMSHDVT